MIDLSFLRNKYSYKGRCSKCKENYTLTFGSFRRFFHIENDIKTWLDSNQGNKCYNCLKIPEELKPQIGSVIFRNW